MAGAERRQRAGRAQKQLRSAKRRKKLVFLGAGFQEEETFPEIEEIREDEADYEDFTDEEDDDFRESRPLGVGTGDVRPLWMYAGGKILWCNPKFGFHLRFREGFRQMIESFLGEFVSLGGQFVRPSPFFLFGFFREEWIRCWFMHSGDEKDEVSDAVEGKGQKKKGFTSRLRQFGKVGIVIPGTGLFPLSIFLAGKGQGTNSIPESVERPWVRHAFSARGLGPEFTWKDTANWLPSEYREFILSFNSLLERLLPGIEERFLPVVPADSTLQRKKLRVFKKYLSEENGQ